jgi:hypothetical protein
MKNEKLLDLIIDLQKRLLAAEDRIRVLESQRQFVPANPAPYISVPSVWPIQDNCDDGLGHDYPMPWFGTIPPNCKKCGKPGQSMTITCQASNCS